MISVDYTDLKVSMISVDYTDLKVPMISVEYTNQRFQWSLSQTQFQKFESIYFFHVKSTQLTPSRKLKYLFFIQKIVNKGIESMPQIQFL